MSAFLLSAVLGTWGETGVALSADSFFTVELFSQKSQRRIVHTSSKTEYQMKRRFLLDVIIGKSSSVFQLLSSEN